MTEDVLWGEYHFQAGQQNYIQYKSKTVQYTTNVVIHCDRAAIVLEYDLKLSLHLANTVTVISTNWPVTNIEEMLSILEIQQHLFVYDRISM